MIAAGLVIARVWAGLAGGAGVQPAGEAPGASVPSAATDDAALLEELREIDARGAKIADLSAEFEQQKYTALLKRPLVSSGRVRIAPPRTRWDTLEPRRSVLLVDDKELRLYDPGAGTLEVYELSAGMGRVAASPVPRLEAVREGFAVERVDPKSMDSEAVEGSYVAIGLTPKDAGTAENVAGVRVLIDRATACAVRVEITDPDGDRTVIRFKNVKTNTGLRSAELELEVPPGTKVSRPLEGVPEPPGGGAEGRGP